MKYSLSRKSPVSFPKCIKKPDKASGAQGRRIAKVKVIPELGTLNSAESRVRLAEINARQAETDFGTTKSYSMTSSSAMKNTKRVKLAKQAREELQTAKDNLEIVKEGITKNSASFSSTPDLIHYYRIDSGRAYQGRQLRYHEQHLHDGTTIATVANMNDLIFRGNRRDRSRPRT